jgi:hypothetical protein
MALGHYNNLGAKQNNKDLGNGALETLFSLIATDRPKAPNNFPK